MQKKGFFSIILYFTLCWCAGQAPQQNPFELEHRMRAMIAELSTAAGVTSATVLNPFDVVPHKNPQGSIKTEVRNPAGGFKLQLRPQPSTRKLFVLFFLVGAVGFLAMTFALRRAVSLKIWQAFFSNNYLKQAQRDYTGMIGAAPFYLLYAHFLVNIGLFTFLTLRAFTGDRFNTAGYLELCILLCIAFYLLKNFVVSFGGWVTDNQNLSSQYNLLIIVFCCVLGLFLLPANFFLAFKENSTSFLPFWVAAVITVFYIFRWIRSVGLFGSVVAKNFFHFLLYLCAVEILPIAILVKFILNSLA